MNTIKPMTQMDTTDKQIESGTSICKHIETVLPLLLPVCIPHTKRLRVLLPVKTHP